MKGSASVISGFLGATGKYVMLKSALKAIIYIGAGITGYKLNNRYLDIQDFNLLPF